MPEDHQPTTCDIELTMYSGAKAAIIVCYLPQAMDDHSHTCKALSRLAHTLPHPFLILWGDFKANSAKDDNIRNMPYRRWEGPTTLTLVPQSRLDPFTCIDPLAIWDPKCLTTQNGPNQTITISFLDHNGVLGIASLPLLISSAHVHSRSAITSRVPIIKYPIPMHSLATWKTRVAVESHSPTSLVIATANAILRNLEDGTTVVTPENTAGQQLGGMDSILSLATDLQQIQGNATDMATTMFTLKDTTPCKVQTLPHHLWPKSVLHDIRTIRNRTKALRHLATVVAATPNPERMPLSDKASPNPKLRIRVTDPMILRTIASPPPRSGT